MSRWRRAVLLGGALALSFVHVGKAQSIQEDFDDLGAWSVDVEAGEWTAELGAAVGRGHAWLTYAGVDRSFPEWHDLEVRFTATLEPGTQLHANQRHGDDRVFAMMLVDDAPEFPSLSTGLGRGHGRAVDTIVDLEDTGVVGSSLAFRFGSAGDEFWLDVVPIGPEAVGAPSTLTDWADARRVLQASDSSVPDAGWFAFEVVVGEVSIHQLQFVGQPVETPPATTPPPPPAGGWDVELRDASVRAAGTDAIDVTATVGNLGPDTVPFGTLSVAFQGDELDNRPFDSLGPGGEVAYDERLVVPASLAGSVGTVEIRVDARGDGQPGNNEVRQEVDLTPPSNGSNWSGGSDPSSDGEREDPEWVTPVIVVTVVAVGAATVLRMRRRTWRRRQQMDSVEERDEGRCEPKQTRTIRTITPQAVKRRRVTAVCFDAIEVDDVRVIDPLNKALSARARKQQSRIAAAARALATEVELRATGRPGDRVSLQVRYRGPQIEARFEHEKCAASGRWPPAGTPPAKKWTAKVKDEGEVALGAVVLGDPRMVDLLTPRVAALIRELERLVPRRVSIELGVELRS